MPFPRLVNQCELLHLELPRGQETKLNTMAK